MAWDHSKTYSPQILHNAGCNKMYYENYQDIQAAIYMCIA